jgi:hypothetical protein
MHLLNMDGTDWTGGDVTAEPLLIIPYGDSFVQRGMDILGSPNSLDGGNVDPQLLKWPTGDTSRRGGVQWGFTSVIQDHSAGRYVFDQSLFWGIGGFNTGQLSRVDTTEPYYLTLFLAMLDDAIADGYPVAGVLLNAGVNDHLPTASGGSLWPAQSTYDRLLAICEGVALRDIPIFVNTIPPRGNSASTSARAETPQNVLDANALLLADLEDEPGVSGLVRVVDIWTPLHDSGGQSNDVLAAMVYDGLHLSKEGCVEVGMADIAVMDAYFADVTVDPYSDTDNYLPNADFATATGGTRTRNGNDTTNAGYTHAGTVPASWTLTTCGTAHGVGLTNWNGTDPANVKGHLEVSGADNAITVNLDCDSSGTSTNSRAVRISAEVTLPSTDDLPVGAYYEGLVEMSVTNHAGLRGVSVSIGATEPDATTRWIHSDIVAPNGTANMDIPSTVDLSGLLLRTPPVIRKTGTYGTVLFCVYLYVAGGVADIAGTFVMTNPKVRRAKYLDNV